MTKVVYSPAAEEDLLGIVEFIARDKPQAARNWLQKMREACQLLASQPGWVKFGRDSALVIAAALA